MIYKFFRNSLIKKFLIINMLFNLVFQNLLFSATIVVGSGSTTLDTAANGTQVVNIENPNQNGVSHNDFNKYNVGPQGVIINNSTEMGTSQLGGIVDKNNNLSKSADVIIAEVSGSEKSNIEGYTEIFGKSADFILANPNGIYVNGAGFINTSKVTLTTGNVNVKNGQINFSVKNGKVMVGNKGIDLETVDFFDIISRTASITGDIYGKKEVNLITGMNDYNYNTGEYTVNSESDQKPEISIDTSNLSGIYAGKIKFVSTEKGVGVNSNSKLVADASDVVIDANGNIVLKDTYAKNNVQIKGANSADLSNIQAEKNISINSNGDLVTKDIISENININSKTLENNGSISAKQDLSITSNEKLSNNQTIQGTNISIKSNEIENKGVVAASENNKIDGNKLINSGQIQGLNSNEIEATSVENNGIIVSQNNLLVKTDNLINSGVINATNLVTLNVSSVLQNNGEISSNKNLTISSPVISNSGKIIGIETYDISTKDINLSGILGGGKGNLTTDTLYITNQGQIITDTGSIIGILVTVDGNISSTGDLSIVSTEVQNKGDITSNQNLNISSSKISNVGSIKSSKDLSIQGQVIVNDGQIISQNGLKIEGTSASSLENNGVIAGFNKLDIIKIDSINNKALGILYSKNNLSIESNTTLNNLGKINGVDTVNLNSTSINNSGSILAGKAVILKSDNLNNSGKIIGSEKAELNVNNSFLNFGEIKGEYITLQSNYLENSGNILASIFDLKVNVLENKSNAYLQGEKNLNVSSKSITNNGNMSSEYSLVLFTNYLVNNKDIQSNGSIEITGESNILNNGLISSLETTKIMSNNTITNNGTIIGTDITSVSSTLNNLGKIAAANDIEVSSQTFNNSGQTIGANNIKASGNTNNTGDIVQLSENGKITFENGTVKNEKNIIATGDIDSSKASSITNKSTIISQMGDISLVNLDNQAGTIQAENNISIQNNSTLNNTNGLISSLSDTGLVSISASGLVNTNGKILGNNEVRVEISGDLTTSGEIQGFEKTYLQANNIKVATNLLSSNIELKSYFDTIIDNQVYGEESFIVNSSGNIVINNKVSSLGLIELNSSKDFVNKGSVLSDNFLNISGANITNNALLYGKNQIVLKSDGKIYNNNTILSSEGYIFIQGNKNNRASEFENYTGLVEASEGISIKSNEVKNTGVAEGTPTMYFVQERDLPNISENDSWEGELGRYKVDNSTFTVKEASIKADNIFIEGNNLNNYGSLIGASNDLTLKIDGNISNQTPVYSSYKTDYILKGKVWYSMRHESGGTDVNGKREHGEWVREKETKKWYEAGTVSVESKDKAQIIAGNNLSIIGSYVGNGIQQRTDFSNTANNQKIEITDTVIDKVKTTGRINVDSNIVLPKGEFGLFKINDEFSDSNVEGIKVGTANSNFTNDNHLVDSNSTDVKATERETPNYHYLVETNIEFLDLSRYYGSSYFFDKIGFNPDKDVNINLIGDSYYETQLINNSIKNALGKQYLYSDVYSDSEQMKLLYDNAETVMNDLKLSVGVELTKEQINNLNKDIIWLVEKVIDGKKVLVPQLYLCQQTLENISVEGSIIKAGNNLNIVANTVNNTGNISANNVSIKANDISNISVDDIQSQITGNKVSLVAKNNILNKGAMVYGSDSVDLLSEGNIVFDTVKTVTNTNLSGYDNTTIKNTSSYIGGGNITISSAKDLVLKGTDIDSNKNINLSAGENIAILAAVDSSYTKTVEESHGLFSSKKTTTEIYDESAKGSNIEASGNIVMNAGHNVNIVGSNIQNTEKEVTTTDEKGEAKTEKAVDGSIEINAKDNVKISEAREIHTSKTVVEEKGFVFNFDLANLSLKAGIESNKSTEDTLQDIARGSGLDGGNIALEGKEITLQGAKVNSNSDVNLTADDVKILEAKDIYKTETKTETTFVGLNASANQSLVHADDNLKKVTQVGDQLSGNRSDIANGAFGVVDGIRSTADAINAVPDSKGSGPANDNKSLSDKMSADYNNLGSFSIGVQHTTTTTQDYSETAVASDLQAKNINIKSKKDTTIQGSNLNASENIVIEAENLNVLASQTKSTSSSSSQTESLTVGLGTRDWDPTSVTASLSQNTADNEKITNQNAKLTAGGNLKVTTTNDMIVKGGVVKADTVDLDIGNNLIVQSVQDTEKGKTAANSVSVTYAIASQSLSGSLATQNGYTDNAWVTEQSGITAKNGGTITVANNTELKGAVIASENSDKAVELDTKTFTYEDIKDKQEGETKGISISGGIGSAPATSVQYASNDKRQDTNATLSNVKLKVDGKDVDPNTTGVNTDITKAQVITKDDKVDMIDVNLQTDLANKEERDKIRDAKDKVGDVVETVKNAIDIYKGKNSGSIEQNFDDNRFITKGSNGVEDNEELSKVLKNLGKIEKLSEEEYSNLSPEEQSKYNKTIDNYKDVVIEVYKEMYFANGFSNIPNIKFEEEVNGSKVAARGESGVIYINVEELLGKSPTDVVSILAHEAVHSEKITESSGSKLKEEIFVKEKEERVKDKYKEEKEGLSEEDQEEYLAKLKEENKELREDSEKLDANSFSEEVEGYTITGEPISTGILLALGAHTYMYNTNKEYKELIDNGVIKIINGITTIDEAVAKKFKLSVSTLKTKITGFMSKDESPKYEEELGKDSNALTDFLKEKESFPLVNNYGYTESMDYDKPLDFKESFPSGEKQGVMVLTSNKEVPNYVNENRIPLDKETILNTGGFQKTNIPKVKGAQVYKNGDYYYHRDTFHKGKGSHLEVYDKKGNHIGEASPISGKLVPGTKDPTKKINVK